MLRHLVILARERSFLPERLTFTLDRHIARGEQIEIMQDRRGAADSPRAPQWPTGRERRRVSALAEQLRTLGYTIFSREDDTPAPAAAPPPTPPRSFARAPVAAAAAAYAAPRASRGRLSDDPDDDLQDEADFEDERSDFLRPRRGGLLIVVLVVVATTAVLTAAMLYLSTQPRGRLAGAPATTAPADTQTAPPLVPATEDGVRDASSPVNSEAPAASSTSNAVPAPPLPTAPPVPAVSPAPAPAEAPAASAPAARELPASPALPPRRAQAPAGTSPPAATTAAAPAATPASPAVRSQTLPVFPGLPRVEISRASSPDVTTFTVRLTDPRGRPMPDAQVWVRERLLDGFVRETRLDPVTPAGSYRGAVPVDTRRSEAITVRFVLGDMRGEMPVTD
jgi:hypothetical protein